MKSHGFFSRAVTQFLTFLVFLAMLCVIVGATGFSDKMLRSTVNEELRGLHQSLATSIRDPKELQRVLALKKKELEEIHGLDKPWVARVPSMMGQILRLNWGHATQLRSNSGNSKISTIIWERMPNTIILMTTSFFIVSIIGIFVGARTATKAGSMSDRMLSWFAAITNALPAWWLGILLVTIFAVMWNILPAYGMYNTPPPTGGLLRFLDQIKHAILPIVSLTLVSVGPYIYQIRQMTVKTAQEPFVMFARARGLSERRIRWQYILRPAAPPIVTGLGFGLAASFSGAILTETVFNWPGMGRLYYEAFLGTPDMRMILVLTTIYGAMFMITRFALESIYHRLDPRIR